MPQVNLSDLSGPDLRRLLDATRGRGDAALSYTILQEMAARREGRGQRGRFLMRRRAEPHVVAVDLGNPMERDDDLPPMPHWRQPPPEAAPEPEASAAAEPEPPPSPAERRPHRRQMAQPANGASVAIGPEAAADDEPAPPSPLEAGLRIQDADPETPQDATTSQDWDLRLRDRGRTTRRAPRRGLVPGLAVGIAVGVGLGWWLSGIVRDAPLPFTAPFTAPAAAPAPAAPLAAEFEPAPDTPPDPVVESPQPAPDAVEVAGAAEAEAIKAPPAAPPSPEAVASAETPPVVAAAPAAPVVRDACAAEETPADRQICGDPQLRQLQRKLRQAYAAALDAHQDRALLRERQLAWKSARDSVSDPDSLAALYEERIRKLHAATAAAQQQR